MLDLKHIRRPIASELDKFDKVFRQAVQSKTPLLNTITRYIIKSKGKQMRPMFVFLSAGVSGGINETSYRAATLIELLHTATLVHDDVVDDSYERRGFFSVNALWKNKIAVLVGDYLLSRGMLLALQHDDFQLLKIVSQAVKEMSEGELLQIEKARKLDIEEDIYFEIIQKKTASLIASCCAVGAASTGAGTDLVERMQRFGNYVGIAFQIKDDIFDFEERNQTGKPSGIDIKERKMTLPLIYLLNNSSRAERRKIINQVRNHHDDPQQIYSLIETVRQSGGLEYANKKMHEYVNKALKELSGLPQTDYLDSLKNLVKFSIQRNK